MKAGDVVFKFRFACSNEKQVRNTFQNMMLGNTSHARGFFGFRLWRRGLHITECGESVKGFYVPEHDWSGSRGSPTKASFRGGFVKKGDDTFFEVCIYPRISEFVFIVLVYASSMSIAEPIGACFLTFIFLLFCYGYYTNIKEAADAFRCIVR